MAKSGGNVAEPAKAIKLRMTVTAVFPLQS